MPSKTKAATAAVKPTDEAVRHRAYALWEADGRPHGMSDHYWHLAMAEMTERAQAPAKASKDAAPAKPEAAKAEKPAKSAEPVVKKAAPKPRAAVAAKKPAKSATASA